MAKYEELVFKNYDETFCRTIENSERIFLFVESTYSLKIQIGKTRSCDLRLTRTFAEMWIDCTLSKKKKILYSTHLVEVNVCCAVVTAPSIEMKTKGHFTISLFFIPKVCGNRNYVKSYFWMIVILTSSTRFITGWEDLGGFLLKELPLYSVLFPFEEINMPRRIFFSF